MFCPDGRLIQNDTALMLEDELRWDVSCWVGEMLLIYSENDKFGFFEGGSRW